MPRCLSVLAIDPPLQVSFAPSSMSPKAEDASSDGETAAEDLRQITNQLRRRGSSGRDRDDADDTGDGHDGHELDGAAAPRARGGGKLGGGGGGDSVELLLALHGLLRDGRTPDFHKLGIATPCSFSPPPCHPLPTEFLLTRTA